MLFRSVNSTELGDTLSSRSLNKRSTQQDTENSSTDEVSAADTAESASGREDSEQAQPVSLFALQRSYIEKGARVFSLDTEKLTDYNTSTIIRAGNYTYGVLSIDQVTAQENYLKKRIAEYEEKEVDIIICEIGRASCRERV